TTFTVTARAEYAGNVDEVLRSFTSGPDDPTVTEVARPCDETFSDRRSWATCLVDSRDETVSYDVASHFYDFSDVYGSDRRMRECMKSGGRWSAVPKDTPEWERAESQARLDEVERAKADARKKLDRLRGR